MAIISAGFVARTRKRGFNNTLRLAVRNLLIKPCAELRTTMRTRKAPVFFGPTPDELRQIEGELEELAVPVKSLVLDPMALARFKVHYAFPDDYHGGQEGGVYDDKLVEHFIAYHLCGLNAHDADTKYVDVAAGSSPWARILRTHGMKAYAIDLSINPSFKGLDYYLAMDATATAFSNDSVDAMSLQCAYEMFFGDSDGKYLDECQRVLKPGGVVVISPLYMHTHHCGYSSPEYWGKGYADAGAVEYVRREIRGIPFSRKYSAKTLKQRVLDRLSKHGMGFIVYRLDNKVTLGKNIYCHFILAFTKTPASSQ